MEQFNNALKEITEVGDCDLYLFSASIDFGTADTFINLLRKQPNKKKKCGLVLTTSGGDPDAGYRIIRCIKRYYSYLTLYVFGHCKSTGTLMALGADEIVMSDFGEFGPLDIQLAKDDELYSYSGLNFAQSLMSLNEHLFNSFEHNFLEIKRRSGGGITTKTASEICSKMAIGLISPISAQIDPVKLGEVQRAMQIANEYGRRLNENDGLIGRLIVGYPSHGFVIDFEECQNIFGENVRWVNENESVLEQFLYRMCRHESETTLINIITPIDDEPARKQEKVETKVNKTEETKEPKESVANDAESPDIGTAKNNGHAKSKKS